jgi:hypothetical protein
MNLCSKIYNGDLWNWERWCVPALQDSVFPNTLFLHRTNNFAVAFPGFLEEYRFYSLRGPWA